MTGVTYVKEKPDLILMHDDNTIAVLDKEKDMPEPSAKVENISFSRFEMVLFQLVYNDPRSTPSDDQSQDGSSYCPSLSPSSTKDILGQVGVSISQWSMVKRETLYKFIIRTLAYECPGNIVTSWASCTSRYILVTTMAILAVLMASLVDIF